MAAGTYKDLGGNVFQMVDIVYDPVTLAELLRGPNGSMAKHVTRVCIRTETEAKRRCPVLTGRLRSSIRFMVQEESGGIVGYVGSDVEYTVYVEMGTEHAGAQPFLRPALDVAIHMSDL
jgi:HK97 gp10 family phage protein